MKNQYANPLSGTATPPSFNPPFSTQTPAPAPAYPQTLANGSERKRKLTHKCPWEGCDRWLSCPHNVQQHIREKHTGERPYACTLCPKTFKRPFVLYRHLEGKHGIADAAPGRGKGGGLKRIGIEGVKEKRKNGRKEKKKASEIDKADVLMGEGNADGVPAHTGFQQQAQSTTATEPKGFEVNNFAPIPTGCNCGAQFDNREALLAHLHTGHHEPPSLSCNCMLCLEKFGGEVDAAGVHAWETGAVKMRRLMANDLFGFDGDKDTMMSHGMFEAKRGPEAAPAAPIDKAAANREAVKRALASMGMTEEQFTANKNSGRPVVMSPFAFSPTDQAMPQAPAAPLPGMNIAETTADSMDATDFDDVDAWLKSADEVFGGADEMAGYRSMW